ncbi:hypothetical protein NXC14_PA00148 (plasmid) [Rhizobium sp. NXC14]|nr:hypothetical protein NXC14_PA00148 [Rhizobium sp. NXC14]
MRSEPGRPGDDAWLLARPASIKAQPPPPRQRDIAYAPAALDDHENLNGAMCRKEAGTLSQSLTLRRVRRLLKRIRAGGAAATGHKTIGRPSNNRIMQRILAAYPRFPDAGT